ncbi:uncharacterized protein LOC144432364 [Styela clava]
MKILFAGILCLATKMGNIENLFLVVCLLVGNTFSRLCPKTEEYQAIDWDRLRDTDGTWFDGLDIPAVIGTDVVDCWDMHHFKPVENGVVFNVTQYVHGRPKKDLLDVRFYLIRKRETYILDPQHKSTFLAVTKKSYSHDPSDAMDREIENFADIMFVSEFFFMTNYDTYFVMASCSPIGMMGFSFFRTITPTARAVYDMWNVFADHNEVTGVGWENICFNRGNKTEQII